MFEFCVLFTKAVRVVKDADPYGGEIEFRRDGRPRPSVDSANNKGTICISEQYIQK